MESKDRIPQNFDVLDLSRAMNSFKREHIVPVMGYGNNSPPPPPYAVARTNHIAFRRRK